MKVGESYNTQVKAIEKWNDTEIILVAGQTYHFHAPGEWTDWIRDLQRNKIPVIQLE